MLRTAHARVTSRLLLLLSERLDVLLSRMGQLRGVDVGRLLLHRLVGRRSLVLCEELVEIPLRSAALLRRRSHGVALLTDRRSASTVDLRSRSTAVTAVHHHLPKQLVLNFCCVGRRESSSRAKTERRGGDGLLSKDGLLVLGRGGTHARSWAASTHLLELAQLVDRVASAASEVVGRRGSGGSLLLSLGIEENLQMVSVLPSSGLLVVPVSTWGVHG